MLFFKGSRWLGVDSRLSFAGAGQLSWACLSINMRSLEMSAGEKAAINSQLSNITFTSVSGRRAEFVKKMSRHVLRTNGYFFGLWANGSSEIESGLVILGRALGFRPHPSAGLGSGGRCGRFWRRRGIFILGPAATGDGEGGEEAEQSLVHGEGSWVEVGSHVS